MFCNILQSFLNKECYKGNFSIKILDLNADKKILERNKDKYKNLLKFDQPDTMRKKHLTKKSSADCPFVIIFHRKKKIKIICI